MCKSKFFKISKKKLFIFSFFLVSFAFLGIYLNQFVKKKGYNNLFHFITKVTTNYNKSFDAEYEKIYINISESDFKKLQSKRDKYLQQGIITNDGDRYINATITHKNKKIKCKLRLKGHMTDHLQDKKWSFRVKTKGNDALMGMTKFTLQHPGTRAYANEWVYHRWLQYEDIFHLRYFFLKVFVNDEDWGIYALEEHFSDELLAYNKKVLGPILRFNPDMYWHGRISEKNYLAIDEQFTSFQSSYIEAYNQDDLLESESGKNTYNKSIQLLEEFRRGQKKTSQVFDVEKMAKFHAIIDVIGGQHSLDWSDVKYYYNPNIERLEPVGYESFSVNKITQISGANKYFTDNSNYENFHQMIFSDSTFFSKYIYYLHLFSKKEYLDKFFNDIDASLQQQLAILYSEFPYKNFDNKIYYQNAETINKILNAPASVEAHLQIISNDTVSLNVACIDAFPYVSGALLIDDFVIDPIKPDIIPAKQLNKPMQFLTIKYVIDSELISQINTRKSKKIRFRNKLLGTNLFDTLWRETKVLPYNSFEENTASKHYIDISQLPFVMEDKLNYTFIILPGNHTFKQHVFVPQTHTLLVKPGANISFTTNSSLNVYTAIYCNGDDENKIEFNFYDTITQLFITSDKSYKSKFNNCILSSHGKSNNSSASHINIYNTNVEINNCLFAFMSNTALNITNSNASFYSAAFMFMFNDAIKINYSNLSISNSSFNKISDKSILSTGSTLSVNNTYFSGRNSTALLLKQNSYARLNNITVSLTDIAIKLVDGSSLYAGDIKFNNVQLGIVSEKKSDSYGNSYIRINNLEYTEVKELIQKNKSTSIHILKQVEN